MKKVLFLLAMLSLGTLCWAGSAREDATDRLDNATKVVHEIMAMPDNGIPEEVLEHAKCVAVVPHMVKAGFIFGGKEGAQEREANVDSRSWSLAFRRKIHWSGLGYNSTVYQWEPWQTRILTRVAERRRSA